MKQAIVTLWCLSCAILTNAGGGAAQYEYKVNIASYDSVRISLVDTENNNEEVQGNGAPYQLQPFDEIYIFGLEFYPNRRGSGYIWHHLQVLPGIQADPKKKTLKFEDTRPDSSGIYQIWEISAWELELKLMSGLAKIHKSQNVGALLKPMKSYEDQVGYYVKQSKIIDEVKVDALEKMREKKKQLKEKKKQLEEKRKALQNAELFKSNMKKDGDMSAMGSLLGMDSRFLAPKPEKNQKEDKQQQSKNMALLYLSFAICFMAFGFCAGLCGGFAAFWMYVRYSKKRHEQFV